MKSIKDERIIHEAQKQNSVGFTLLYYGLLIDLLYRQFILYEPLSKLWDLALLFFGVTFYLAGKRISSGLLGYKPNLYSFLKTTLPSSFIAALVFVLVNTWWRGNSFSLQVLLGGFIFLICFSLVLLIMQRVSNKKNDDLLKDD